MAITLQYKIRYCETMLRNGGINEVSKIAFTVDGTDDADGLTVSWQGECSPDAADVPVQYTTLVKADLVAIIKDLVGVQHIKDKIKNALKNARTTTPVKRNFPWV